ncbi:MAG: MFS transporter [Oscillospiraceae bacterium]|nr:MFS transporter [Oscillospiraceae bacterium]
MQKKLWNRDFILLLQANAVSTIGDLMYSVAIGYWVYEKTGSSALMGVMSSISMFVTMFLSPFTGSIVDKCSRKGLMVTVDTVQGLLMLTIGVLAWRDALSVPVVLIAAFLAAFGSVFYSPAVNTLILDIIPKDDLLQGQSAQSGILTLINLVGSAFSGVMVAFFGVPLIVVINGLSNLYSALSEIFIRMPKTVGEGTPITVKGVLQDTGKAVKALFSDPFLRLFVPMVLVLNLLGSGPMALTLPFCMEKGFTVEMYGYLGAVYMIGSLICVMVLGAVKLPKKVRYMIFTLGFCLSVPLYTAAYFAGRFVPMCIFAFLACMGNSAGNTILNASMMLALPEENRGAILGFLTTACTGGSALSTLIYGFLGDIFPLYLVFAVGNILSLVPMLVLCLHRLTKRFMLEH